MDESKDNIEGRDEKGRFLPRHAAYSGCIRRRYRDRRTAEGKQLTAVMDALVEDLGGQENLNAGQRLLLDTIESKLVVIIQISRFVDTTTEIIKDGRLLPVLGKNYLAYLNALRLSIDQLYKDHWRGKAEIPSIQDIIAEGKNK